VHERGGAVEAGGAGERIEVAGREGVGDPLDPVGVGDRVRVEAGDHRESAVQGGVVAACRGGPDADERLVDDEGAVVHGDAAGVVAAAVVDHDHPIGRARLTVEG